MTLYDLLNKVSKDTMVDILSKQPNLCVYGFLEDLNIPYMALNYEVESISISPRGDKSELLIALSR